MLDFYVKRKLFEIIEVEITSVDCIKCKNFDFLVKEPPKRQTLILSKLKRKAMIRNLNNQTRSHIQPSKPKGKEAHTKNLINVHVRYAQ